MTESRTIFTVGHSTRPAAEFVELLGGHGVDLLVDVRRHPTSRRHPQFDREALAVTLEESGVGYRHEEALGGRRKLGDAPEDGPCAGWRSDGFRAYARHMNGKEARKALDRLEREATDRHPAVMCAEAVPWRCHRQIIADHLVARGHRVIHLLDREGSEPHELREMARVQDDGRVNYPARQPGLFDG